MEYGQNVADKSRGARDAVTARSAANLHTPRKSLTIKQEKFACHYLEFGDASQAYRHAYSVKRMSSKAVNVEAHRVLAHPGVALRVAKIITQAADKAMLTRSWIIERLMRNADKGHDMGDLTVANKALELLGKTDDMRLFVERTESDNRYHHSAGALSPFAEHLAAILAAGAEGPAPGSLPH